MASAMSETRTSVGSRAIRHPPPAPAETVVEPMRVLVIDDEPDVLLLCRVNLQYAGHEVIEALDGERGLELAVSGTPDLIVLDVMLPRRDGLSVLRDLAANPATSGTPVVLLTA